VNGMPGGRASAVSVVIATAFRDATLERTLRSVAAQTLVPDEVVIVDGAPSPGAEPLIERSRKTLGLNIRFFRSSPPGAAVQRNVGVRAAAGEILVFLDDDAYPETDCFEQMVQVLDQDAERRVGGVGALIRNQPCSPPSRLAKRWFDFLADERQPSYAGMVIGPAVAIGPWPDGRQDPIRVEWLMSTCVAYRRSALSAAAFNPRFVGYSFMEDVELSLRVGRRFALVVQPRAYIFHDAQTSRFKHPYVRARMVVANRYYVMTSTLARRTLSHHARFVASLAVPQLTSLRDVRGPRAAADWLLSCGGTLVGLVETGVSALRRDGVSSEAHVGL
jgi:GT2 family glycosyltransferase